MKTYYIPLIALLLSLTWSCQSETIDKIKDVKNKVSTASSVVGNISNMEENAKNMESRMDELKEMTAITNAEFKDWMPETLDGLPRKSYEFNTMMGATGSLSFADDDKAVEVNIMDGAGETGSALYASQGMLGALYGGFESESDIKKQEIVERNGEKSIETYYKDKNNAEIRITVDNRFIVSANGRNMTPDELFAYVEKLNVSKLN